MLLRRYGDDTPIHTANMCSQKTLSRGNEAMKERWEVLVIFVQYCVLTYRRFEGGKLLSKRLLRKTNKGPKWLEKVSYSISLLFGTLLL
jgi:hypothetical protein